MTGRQLEHKIAMLKNGGLISLGISHTPLSAFCAADGRKGKRAAFKQIVSRGETRGPLYVGEKDKGDRAGKESAKEELSRETNNLSCQTCAEFDFALHRGHERRRGALTTTRSAIECRRKTIPQTYF